MKIEKKTVQSGILKLEKNVQITIDQDMNVPDTKPDVEKVVESRGEVHVDEIEMLTDRIRIRGMFLVQILYLSSEKELKISWMEHELSTQPVVCSLRRVSDKALRCWRAAECGSGCGSRAGFEGI